VCFIQEKKSYRLDSTCPCFHSADLSVLISPSHSCLAAHPGIDTLCNILATVGNVAAQAPAQLHLAQLQMQLLTPPGSKTPLHFDRKAA